MTPPRFLLGAITFFSLSKHILKNLTEGGEKKEEEEEEPAGFKLSAKSKLYVHDMSEAMLTALSVCSASAKPIVVFVSFSAFFPLPRGKLSVLPALKGKQKLKEKIYRDRIYYLFIFF